MPIVGSAAQLGNKRNLHVKCLKLDYCGQNVNVFCKF